MSYRYIKVEQDESGIVVVTIDDPDAKNAVNFEMNRELVQELARIESEAAAALEGKVA